MARYYNKNRGPLPVQLRSGKSVSIPGKGWVTIDPEDEGSADVLMYVRRGALIAAKIQHVAEPEAPATNQAIEPLPNALREMPPTQASKSTMPLDEIASSEVETVVASEASSEDPSGIKVSRVQPKKDKR